MSERLQGCRSGQSLQVDPSALIAEWAKVHGIGHIVKDVWFYPEQESARG